VKSIGELPGTPRQHGAYAGPSPVLARRREVAGACSRTRPVGVMLAGQVFYGPLSVVGDHRSLPRGVVALRQARLTRTASSPVRLRFGRRSGYGRRRAHHAVWLRLLAMPREVHTGHALGGMSVNQVASGVASSTVAGLANLAVRAGSGCPREGSKKARK